MLHSPQYSSMVVVDPVIIRSRRAADICISSMPRRGHHLKIYFNYKLPFLFSYSVRCVSSERAADICISSMPAVNITSRSKYFLYIAFPSLLFGASAHSEQPISASVRCPPWTLNTSYKLPVAQVGPSRDTEQDFGLDNLRLDSLTWLMRQGRRASLWPCADPIDIIESRVCMLFDGDLARCDSVVRFDASHFSNPLPRVA